MADQPTGTSAAVLVVDNESLAVRAYVGSADFLDEGRLGHVDMVRALRSPGSTLKPFLYAVALEEGLIHSESLLVDAPFSFSGYRPENFARHFSGPVSAAEALRRSLNLPAVDLLDRLGPEFFDARLRQGGLRLHYPGHARPNLSLILGGVGVRLEALVGAFRALAQGGLSGRPRLTWDQPRIERRFLDPGAAYIVRRILSDAPRPDLPGGRLVLDRSRRVAWKTGTSYGFRDAWCIGVNDGYTVGVWVGRPDGTPSPGRHGRSTAAPLLFRIIDILPRRGVRPGPPPENVSRQEICWPLGTPPSGEEDPLCHLRRSAWVLDRVVPPTLPDRTAAHWRPNPVRIWLDPATGMRVAAGCTVPGMAPTSIARWPKRAESWLSPRLRRRSAIPPFGPACRGAARGMPDAVRIIGIEPDAVLRPPGSRIRLPAIALEAQGGRGGLYWLLNGELVACCGIGEIRHFQLRRTGRHRLTVMDHAGNFDAVAFEVAGGFPEG
jgi:penicillin-binding protein 1C